VCKLDKFTTVSKQVGREKITEHIYEKLALLLQDFKVKLSSSCYHTHAVKINALECDDLGFFRTRIYTFSVMHFYGQWCIMLHILIVGNCVALCIKNCMPIME